MKTLLLSSLCCFSICVQSQLSFTLATGSPIALPNSTSMQGLVSGDLNNDGIKDLIVGNGYNSTLNILLGNGGGQFSQAPGSPMTVNTGPLYVAVADFNSDQKNDLATANYNSGDISILMGAGNGSFTPAPGSPIITGYLPYSIDAADFNMDGKMDLVTCSAGANNVMMFSGNGMGGFSLTTTISAGGMPYHVSAGKFNSDNFPDIAFVNGTGNSLQVYLGNGAGAFTQVAGSPYSTGNEPRTIAIGDLNGDGFNDFSIPDETGGDLNIFFGSASGTFVAAPTSPILLSAGQGPFESAIADYDLDGDNDIVISNTLCNGIYVLLGNGSGSFVSGTPINVGSGSHSLWGSDYNNDGKADVAVAEWSNNHVRVFLNTTPCSVAAGISHTAQPNGNVNFSSYSTGTTTSSTYVWYFGDNSSAQGASVSHVFGNGTYTVTLVIDNRSGCKDSSTVVITVENTVGIKPIQSGRGISVYPCPTADILNVSLPRSYSEEDLLLVVYSAIGKEKAQFKLNFQISELDLRRLEAGTYFYRIFQNSANIKSGSFVLVR